MSRLTILGVDNRDASRGGACSKTSAYTGQFGLASIIRYMLPVAISCRNMVFSGRPPLLRLHGSEHRRTGGTGIGDRSTDGQCDGRLLGPRAPSPLCPRSSTCLSSTPGGAASRRTLRRRRAVRSVPAFRYYTRRRFSSSRDERVCHYCLLHTHTHTRARAFNGLLSDRNWYGHVLRKDDDDWVKKCMEHEVEGSRPRGRPKRTWKEVVREDCQARKLNKEDAMDRCKWRKVIKEAR